MDYVQLGSSKLEVSRLCLGTWNMAGQKEWGPEEDARSVDLIRRVQDSGCTFFDSAHAYGRGHSEEVLGRALAEDGRRERAVIATKIMQCRPKWVERQLDGALRRLRTDHVDLYLVHWPNPSLDLRAFLEKMSEMKEKGKALELGVSNFNLQQLKVAAQYGIRSLQPPYNILWRIIEPELLPFCRQSNIAVTPYSPLAQGLLTGRFLDDSEKPTGIRHKNQLFQEPAFSKAREAARVVADVAEERGATCSQVALAWLLETEGVTAPIVGISRWEHWQDNVGALNLELSDGQYERISEAGQRVWDLFPEDATMWGWKPK